MHNELQPQIKPEILLAEFDSRRPVLMVAHERNEVGSDSTYDKFMYHYVGDPLFHDNKNVISTHPEFGEVNHNYRRLKEFSQNGDLIVLREDRRLPYVAAARYLPVTASLVDRAITSWVVTEVRFPRLGRETGLELMLSSRRLEVVEATQNPTGYPLNTVKFILDLWQGAQPKKQQASILLANDQCLFTDQEGRQVAYCADLEQLHLGLQTYKKLEQEAGEVAMMDVVERTAG